MSEAGSRMVYTVYDSKHERWFIAEIRKSFLALMHKKRDVAEK